MKEDKVGGTQGTAQYFSRRNILQLQPQLLPSYLLHVFCVYIVSEECSRCFMGSHEVKSKKKMSSVRDEDVVFLDLATKKLHRLQGVKQQKWQDFPFWVIYTSALISRETNKRNSELMKIQSQMCPNICGFFFNWLNVFERESVCGHVCVEVLKETLWTESHNWNLHKGELKV